MNINEEMLLKEAKEDNSKFAKALVIYIQALKEVAHRAGQLANHIDEMEYGEECLDESNYVRGESYKHRVLKKIAKSDEKDITEFFRKIRDGTI